MLERVKSARNFPAFVRLWLTVSSLFPGLLESQARRAHQRQRADPTRLQERFGKPTLPRPGGKLVWIHAASVGEVASIARLAKALLTATPEQCILVTTATNTGAETVSRLIPGALHQFLPVDTPVAVQAFLDHWRPDAALFVEGDLWPNLILSLDHRDCPMALLNARWSRSRERFPKVYAALLEKMALVTVQESALLSGLIRLGLDPARLHAPGNLKADVTMQDVDEDLHRALTAASDGRGIWAAVSTHAGEESLILDAHAAIPGSPLLVLVPRHPERGAAVAQELRRRRLSFTVQSQAALPGTDTDVHLVDVLGQTGTVFAGTGLACIGGSFLPNIGGHTPFEPAVFGCAILSGPYVDNFSAAYRSLASIGAARMISDGAALSVEVRRLLQDPSSRRTMQSAARRFHAANAGATDTTLTLLKQILT